MRLGLHYSAEIVSRTEKTVKIKVHGQTKRRGLTVVDGVEQFKPFGTYSMSPTMRANKENA